MRFPFSRKPKLVESINHFDSLIAQSMIVAGNIQFSGSLKIEGQVMGDIEASGGKQTTVLIQKTGVVAKTISADSVIVHGEVFGNIDAKSVMIGATARFPANCVITYDVIQVEAGAMLNNVQLRSRQGFAQPEEVKALPNA